MQNPEQHWYIIELVVEFVNLEDRVTINIVQNIEDESVSLLQ